MRLHLLHGRHRISIVELVYFSEVAVAVNDNQIACITDAEQISVDLSPGSVGDIMLAPEKGVVWSQTTKNPEVSLTVYWSHDCDISNMQIRTR